jgi:hypothetical protein
MSLQVPHREKANGVQPVTKAVILVGAAMSCDTNRRVR